MASLSNNPTRLSIIIEWDNVRLSELGRAKSMLARLGEQLHALHEQAVTAGRAPNSGAPELGTQAPADHLRRFIEPAELLVGYNDAEIDPQELRPIVRDFFDESHACTEVHLLAATDANYYRLKNTCVRQARGDLIVFVDSDVIPEDGWLEALVQPFADPAVNVVAGNTYIEPHSFYSRTLALSFFFPLRAEDGPLAETDWFFANNCAFRRQVLLDHPFPERSDQFRGQCDELARALLARGIRIHWNPRARVDHPPPNGLRHFINRAVCEGHDFALEAALANGRRPPTLRSCIGRSKRRWANALQRIRRKRREVGLSAAAVPAAMAIATSYYSFYLLGEVLGRTSPKTVRKWFAI